MKNLLEFQRNSLQLFFFWHIIIKNLLFKKKLGFTPRKAEQPLQGMELQEKEAQED